MPANKKLEILCAGGYLFSLERRPGPARLAHTNADISDICRCKMGICHSQDVSTAAVTESSSSSVSRNLDTPPSKPVSRAGPNITCSICAYHGGETVIPVAKVTNRCSKTRTICCSCMERHIDALVGKQTYTIPCLCSGTGQSACRVRLTFDEVREHATAQVFARYDEGKLHSALESDPEFCWCARPGCGSGQMHASMNRYPVMRCHVCRFKTCFRHHCEYHDGRTCEEYERDASRSDEVALLQLLNDSKFRRCPKCSQAVEKNGGCDHMTCRCKHEFCWRCLVPYGGENGIRTIGRRAHKKSCTHYRKD